MNTMRGLPVFFTTPGFVNLSVFSQRFTKGKKERHAKVMKPSAMAGRRIFTEFNKHNSMNPELLLNNISRHITLTKDEAQHFISLLENKEIKKKELVLKEGQICKAIHYVHGGALRAYHVDKNGKESTIMFAMNDWWITDMFCFINQQPAMLFIEAIEDSTIFSLKKEVLDKLYLEIPKFERFFRIIMQNAYIREQLRVIQNLSLSAEERYNHFIAKYPQVVKQVTQKQIASYLGITPEFLSTIRGSHHRKTIS